MLTFVDFEKAFDTVEHISVINALKQHGIENQYIEVLKYIYTNSSSQIISDRVSSNFKIERGVKQGDPISPNLFNAVLEQIFRKLNWDDKNVGVNINGKQLHHLRFADDVVIISETCEETERMLNELYLQSRKDGLKIHMGKTKTMCNKFVKVENINIANNQMSWLMSIFI